MRGADIGSDHHLVVGKLKVSLRKRTCVRRKPRLDGRSLLHPLTQSKFQAEVRNSLRLLQLEPTTSVDSYWDAVSSNLRKAAETVCPKVERHRTQKWITQRTLELVDERRSIKNVIGARPRYQFLCREIKRSLAADKELWWNDRAEDLENAANVGNSTGLFSAINKLLGRSKGVSTSIKDKSGHLIKNKDEKLQRWAEHFSELYNRPDPPTLDNNLLTSFAEASEQISGDVPSIDEVESFASERG